MAHQKKKVVITSPMVMLAKSQLFEDFKQKFHVVEITKESDLITESKDAHAILIKRDKGVSNEVVNAGPNIAIMSRCGVGYDNVDVAHCISKKIWVTHTPGIISCAAADLALFHLLSVSRKFTDAQKLVRAGKWEEGNAILGHDPEGKVLGILGMGAIGKKLALRAVALDMKIIYYDMRKLSPEEEKQHGNAKYVTKDELVAESDFISLHVFLSPETHHLLDYKDFERMKQGVYIINTSRGPTINEQALVDALKSGKVGGAGLDVFEKEPTIHPDLYTLPNVTLTPHVGSATVETRMSMEELALKNVESVLDGKGPLTPVPECKVLFNS